MKYRKTIKNAALLFISLISLTALVLSIITIIYGNSPVGDVLPPLLGNNPDTIAQVDEEGLNPHTFTFFLAGDMRMNENFWHFYENTEFEVSPEFGVIMGDFTRDPSVENHRLFRERFSECKLDYPIFLVAGNHDIAVKGHYDGVDSFTLEDFEDTYGPANFSFNHAGCLFIVINNVYNDAYLTYLADTLSVKSENARMIFVFMHLSPYSIIKDMGGGGHRLMGEEEFFSLMDEFEVDFVFSSDYHSYERIDYGKTRYIISGGGGAHLANEEHSFYHALLIRVDPEIRRVDEIIYPIECSRHFFSTIFQSLFIGYFPIFKYHAFLGVIIFSALVLLFLVSTSLYVFGRKRGK
jgi:hypothetical protein